MERFEELVLANIERRGVALLLVVFTEPEFRQFEYYTSDMDRFFKLLNKIPFNEDLPIEILEDSDPNGEFYGQYASAILKSAV